MNSPAPERDLPPPAEVEARQRRTVSLVWLIPLVAALLGVWLAYKTISEKGPVVTVTFQTAEGIEAAKTKVKYKDVDVGLVDEVAFSSDLSHVVVTASIDKQFEAHLTAGTRFWVVRPRIGSGGVSGLGTLVSGAYLEVDPAPGEKQLEFVGLEEPPLIRSGVPGTQYVLQADSLQSVGRGAPIHYRGIEVGQVLGHELDAAGDGLSLFAFVRAPFDALVRSDSRFWNVSGVSFDAGTEGFNVRIASLQAVLAGGVEFDAPLGGAGQQAPAKTVFPLYPDKKSVDEARFAAGVRFLIRFDGSVRGLRVGAPVEFRGIRVGVVREIAMSFNRDKRELDISVVIDVQPDRIDVRGAAPTTLEASYANAEALIRRGLRAQLASGSLLTGERLVELVLQEGAPPAELKRGGRYPEIPSIPTTLDSLTASLEDVLRNIAALPLDEIAVELRDTIVAAKGLIGSPELKQAVGGVNATVASLRSLADKLDKRSGALLDAVQGAAASAGKTADQAQVTLRTFDRAVGDDSALRHDLTALLKELRGAARSIRLFADYLERNPQALVRGKAGGP